jgi:riboflavin synthase
MFTGLVQGVGTVREVAPRRGATRIGIAFAVPGDGLENGESIAVDGVCLTVTRKAGDRFWVDAVQETLSRTTLVHLRPGARVNLERSLRVGDRLGGHLVQGHVDAVARVVGLRRAGDDRRLRVGLPPGIAHLVADKGSIALNGVSLTVARLAPGAFEVALIPETLARTNLGEARVGQLLNVEVDLLARYLERLLGAGRDGVTRRRPRTGRGAGGT